MLRTTALVAIAGLPLAASASIFSFASDSDHTSYTFGGFGSSVFDAADPGDVFELLVDDDNGFNTPLSFEVEFSADLTLTYLASVPAGGLFVHTYSVDGSFEFADGNGTLLSATISNGAFSALGTQSSWLSTATAQGNDSFASSVQYTWFGADMPDYGLFAGDSVDPDDAAFTLTFLQSGGGSGVALGSDMLPAEEWFSEGSYSGSAQFVPAPGGLALLGLAGLAARRRRS